MTQDTLPERGGIPVPPEGAKPPDAAGDTRAKSRCALLSVISNSALIVLKLAAGIATGSIAVISEAVHSFLDLLAAFMTFAAVRVSGVPPDQDHPFGHGKAENLAALFEAILIIGGGLYIVREAILGLAGGRGLPSAGPGVAVMIISSLVNFFVSRHLFATGRKYASPALVTDAWHLMTDVYTSLGIFGALLAIHVARLIDPALDLGFLDPLAAMCVSFFIIRTGWTLARDALANLVDRSLPDEDLEAIAESIRECAPSIRGYRRLRTRRSGPSQIVVVDLLVDGRMSVSDAHASGEEVSRSLARRFPRADVTFHLEPLDGPAAGPGDDGCLRRDGGERDAADAAAGGIAPNAIADASGAARTAAPGDPPGKARTGDGPRA
ncbi:MAG: cation diffusion facilitator family transporter [Deltaproteobacteria bacterium]|nr:cation diffusion facilitator family transporter [Deltaproteobacteria bacterium]